MNKNRLSLVFCIMSAILLISVFACAQPAPAPTQTTSAPTSAPAPTILKFASNLPPQDMVVTKATEMADRFNQRTKGSYKIEIHAGGTLATMEEAFDMLRKGAVDIVEAPIEYQTGNDPRFAAVTLPFLTKSQMANVEFLRLIDKSLFNQIIAEKFNGMPIAVFVSGVHDYGSSKKLVKTLDDWKGLLVWVANNVEAQTMEAFGAAGVSLPFFEGIPSMQKGVVDSAVGVNPSGIWNFKWYDTIRYITIANMFGTSGYFYINLDTYNKMPKDVQTILLEESARCEQELVAHFDQFAKDSITSLEKEGVQVYRLPDAERAKWIEKSRPVVDAFYAQIGSADAQKVRDAANQANSK